MIDPIAYSLAFVASVGIAAYVVDRYLVVFKKRNDLLDRFQAYERACETRILALEVGLGRFENLLANHERLVARVGAYEAATEKALADLANKWLAEVNQINTRQVAAFTAKPPPAPRFRP